MPINEQILSRAADTARGLSIDAVNACSSGHLGLPLGAAEIGALLYGVHMSYNPADPAWINRDRFILSAGHGSMFLYSWLHLSGFAVGLDDVKSFRKLNSLTPGHPEFGHTPGVEVTSGPLGQGVGNAVGMAVSEKMAAARFNTEEHCIFDHQIIALAGDGCMQEGLSAEAASLAGHLGLDNLTLIYDSNDVTLDAMAEASQSEDTAKRFEAYGWNVHTIDGYDLPALLAAMDGARSNSDGRPTLIIAKTIIGKGMPEISGSPKAHGEGGAKFAAELRKAAQLPEEPFGVPEEVYAFFAEHRKVLEANYAAWQETFAAWKTANPERAALLDSAGKVPADLMDLIPAQEAEKAVATRVSGGNVLQAVVKAMPLFVSGSADLHGSTKNYLNGCGDFNRANRAGRNLLFGIREHAMGAMLNGLAYHGIFRPSGATFLVFSDYLRHAIRLSALANLPVLYYFTHDSIGVGEDGPTHQPIEMTASLRTIPNLDVIRPADAEETAGAIAAALLKTRGPTALILSRQNLAPLNSLPASKRRDGVVQGAYIALEEKGTLETIILSSGSELALAMEAAAQLGDGVRVVSMPCFERFRAQSAEYKEEILPSTCRKRVAIEAGQPSCWYEWTGLDGVVIGLDRFGLSAPGNVAMEELGITTQAVIDAVNSL